jgi:hypothetical protein
MIYEIETIIKYRMDRGLETLEKLKSFLTEISGTLLQIGSILLSFTL